MTVLILRPEPGASATATRAAALGLQPVVAPLFEVRAVAWDVPDPAGFDAVMLTSANAVRHGGAGLRRLTGLPAYVVGDATAQAARAAGFNVVLTGTSDGGALIDRIAHAGVRRLLHLSGREHRGLAYAGLERRIVYASEEVPPPAALFGALNGEAIALLHSPRAAARFAQIVADRSTVRIAAISTAALDAAGSGWRRAAAAAQPIDAALLALAAAMCD